MPIVKVDGKRIKFPDDMPESDILKQLRDYLRYLRGYKDSGAETVKAVSVEKALKSAAKDIVKVTEDQTKTLCQSQERAMKVVSKDIQDSFFGNQSAMQETLKALERPNIKEFSVTTPEGRKYRIDLRTE